MTSGTSTIGWVDDYLARIGVARAVSADLQALRDLQAAHLLAVPFENLSIHLGEPIVLDQAGLVAKVVRMHRGGFCYELNGAFAGLLTALGSVSACYPRGYSVPASTTDRPLTT